MWIKLLPWIGGLLALVLVYSVGSSLVNKWEDSIRVEAHAAGVKDERIRQQKLADLSTNSLKEGATAYSEANIAELKKRAENAEASQRRIANELKNHPVGADCRITQRLLDERNAIRQSLQTAPDTRTGS